MLARLHDYCDRRNFDRTPEPRPDPTSAGTPGSPRFVVQKHDARQPHFDFRLEIDGVLASWVIPRGPAMIPQVNRLALRMEDHPLKYVDFEGVIPEGEYGAGRVDIWDRGTFENATEEDGRIVPPSRALDNGHLVVRLSGERLHGEYVLQRTEKGDDGERWALVRTNDDSAH